MTVGFGKIKVEQIRNALDNYGGDSSITGKGELVDELKRLAEELNVTPDDLLNRKVDDSDNLDINLDEVEMDTADITVDQPNNEPAMTPDSDGWCDYIMRQFKSNELDGGYPKLVGLRRLVKKELGEIISSRPVKTNVFFTDDPHMPPKASCEYEIQVEWKFGDVFYVPLDEIPTRDIRVFGGFAGAYFGNVDGEYAKFPEAIAESRAEARCLRKALNIDVASAEEMSEKTVGELDFSHDAPDKITDNQVGVINRMCARLDIEPQKFINKKYHTGETTEPAFITIKDVDHATAVIMVKELNKYQTDTKSIPSEIKVEK